MIKPEDIPDAFYRVSVKALIFDDQRRLLVFQDSNGLYEIPGGGWEHGETLEECLRRELKEEAGLQTVEIGGLDFCYTGVTANGFPKLSLAHRVQIAPGEFDFGSDDLVAARYVTKDEFLQLDCEAGERLLPGLAEKVWPHPALDKRG